ncbi:hypothetical protein BDFG_02982 [Blastomyces dermatitidis ATCC 26199]|nr:hypothetical protein BDFG_02982 [Blastomyces dermatitidis ATCC 26199]
MRLSTFSLALLLSSVVSATPAFEIFERKVGSSCKTMDGMGVCMARSKCGGVYYDGACGRNSGETRCCVQVKCEVGGKTGQCQNIKRTKCKGGKYHIGSRNTCPAGKNVRCCIEDNDKPKKPKPKPKEPKKPKKPKKSKKPKKPKKSKKTVGQKILAVAMKEKGTRYVWGGGSCKGPTKGGYDCSGLVAYAVCKVTKRNLFREGLRVTYSMYCASSKRLGKFKKVPFSKRRAGDAVFFGSNCSCKNQNISHMGLMINSGDRMIHAPNRRTVVKEGRVSRQGSLKACPYVIRFG